MTKKKSIKGTETEKNLVIAYMAESSAYTRYTYYARQAEKEQYFPVQKVFEETAANEFIHSKVFFKLLEGGNITVPLGVDAGVIGTTADNLACAAHEEEVEGVDLYTKAAETAEKEGFDEIASHFRAIAEVEDHHRRRFLHYLEQVEEGTVWKRDHEIVWKCLVCGYEYKGKTPPKECPGCDHPYQHYMAMDYTEGLD